MLDWVQGHESIDVANQVGVDRDTDAKFFPMFTNSDFPSEMQLGDRDMHYTMEYYDILAKEKKINGRLTLV